MVLGRCCHSEHLLWFPSQAEVEAWDCRSFSRRSDAVASGGSVQGQHLGHCRRVGRAGMDSRDAAVVPVLRRHGSLLLALAAEVFTEKERANNMLVGIAQGLGPATGGSNRALPGGRAAEVGEVDTGHSRSQKPCWKCCRRMRS